MRDCSPYWTVTFTPDGRVVLLTDVGAVWGFQYLSLENEIEWSLVK